MSAPRGQWPLGLLRATEGGKRQRGPALSCAPQLLSLSAAGKEPLRYPPRPALQWERGRPVLAGTGAGGVGWGGAHLSLIRTNTAPGASGVPIAPLLPRRARLSFPGPVTTCPPAGAAGPTTTKAVLSPEVIPVPLGETARALWWLQDVPRTRGVSRQEAEAGWGP